MKQLFKRVLRALTADRAVLGLGIALLIGYVTVEVLIRFTESYANPILRAVALVSVCLIFYCGGRLRLQRTGDRITLRRLFYLFFALYLYLLLSLTLIDVAMGRTGDFLLNNVSFRDERAHYMRWFVNFVPFRSIYELYIRGLIRGYVSFSYVALNFLGNLCLCMPLAFFLPLLWKHQRKWYFFLPTLLLSVALIEALQLFFMVGSCDVDDLILNAAGAIGFYFLLRIPPIKKLIKRLLAGCFD
jgi:glycopeptide antibiotics resistance protein